MKYIESITDFFKQPNFIKNLLFASICLIIPIAGVMVVIGWLAIGLWGRNDRDPATFPDFDFSKFGYYLQRGLWPVLTTITICIGLAILSAIALFIPQLILNVVFGSKGFLGLINSLLSFILNAAIFVVNLAVVVPVMIRAILLQDFVKAFDVEFIKKFATSTWKELLLSALFVYVASLALGGIGLLALCIGVLPASVLMTYSYHHLIRQLYDLYIARGGEPVPVNPLLSDEVSPPASDAV